MPPNPAGFAPVFAGWNVWDLWQADDPDQSILGTIWHAGESQERLLRAWVETKLSDDAPGVAVADSLNPAALRGDQVQAIPKVSGLSAAAMRVDVPELAGAMQLGTADSKATLRSVRFFNRGDASFLPWPHDKNFVVETVYTPSASNPVTNGAAPGSLAGSASALGSGVGSSLETLSWIVGGVALVAVISALRRR